MPRNIVVKNTKSSNLLLLFALFILFGGYYPFEVNAVVLGNQGYNLARLMSLLLICYAVIIRKGRVKMVSKNFSLVVMIQSAFFILWGSYLNSISIIANSIVLFVAYTAIVVVINTIDFRKVLLFFERFTIFSGIMTAIGIVLFSLGMLSVISTFDKGGVLIQNFGFFFVKIFPEDVGMLLNVRPSGYFDEPGSFAYMAMLLLLVNKLYFNNRKVELGLIILPLVTTSMAHIFSVLIYLFLFYFNFKNFHRFAITGTVGILLVSAFAIGAQTNDTLNFFYQRTIGRAELLFSGEGGNSRATGFEMGPEMLAKYPTGVSPEYLASEYPSFSQESIYSIPLVYGFQGVIIYVFPFLFILLLILKSEGELRRFYIKALILWSINLFQRPFYIQPFYIFVMYFLFFNTQNILPKYKDKLPQ